MSKISFQEKMNQNLKVIRERINSEDYPFATSFYKFFWNVRPDDFDQYSRVILNNAEAFYDKDPEIIHIITQKPSWDDAPEWANFLVGSLDGFWCWHEIKPTFSNNEMFRPIGKMKSIDTGIKNLCWRKEIFERPKPII